MPTMNRKLSRRSAIRNLTLGSAALSAVATFTPKTAAEDAPTAKR